MHSFTQICSRQGSLEGLLLRAFMTIASGFCLVPMLTASAGAAASLKDWKSPWQLKMTGRKRDSKKPRAHNEFCNELTCHEIRKGCCSDFVT